MILDRLIAALPIVLALGVGGAGVGAMAYASSTSSGYVDNLEDLTCSDGGTLIESPYQQKALDCTCSAAAYWGDEDVVPLTGKSQDTFNAMVRRVRCRSQSNVTCDCHALVTSPVSSDGE